MRSLRPDWFTTVTYSVLVASFVLVSIWLVSDALGDPLLAGRIVKRAAGVLSAFLAILFFACGVVNSATENLRLRELGRNWENFSKQLEFPSDFLEDNGRRFNLGEYAKSLGFAPRRANSNKMEYLFYNNESRFWCWRTRCESYHVKMGYFYSRAYPRRHRGPADKIRTMGVKLDDSTIWLVDVFLLFSYIEGLYYLRKVSCLPPHFSDKKTSEA